MEEGAGFEARGPDLLTSKRRRSEAMLLFGTCLKLTETTRRWFAVPVLTKSRIAIALSVAVVTDTAQLLVGPLGWLVVDEALDAVAMVLTCWALGFHPLLLPTFVIEFIPVADMLPTWTGCTAAVVALR